MNMNINLERLESYCADNKYRIWHRKIIQTAINRNYKKIKRDGYERHHILPKSLGGNNTSENLVVLTAKEHYIVHLLLVRIINITEYRNKMIFAFFNMRASNGLYKRYSNSRSYLEYKLEWQKLQSINRKKVLSDPEKRKEFIQRTANNVRNPIVRKKISDTLTGRTRNNMNKTTLLLTGENRTPAQKEASLSHSEKMKGKPNKGKGQRSNYGKSVITPDGIFEKGVDACKFYKISSGTLHNRCKKKLYGFKFLD